MAEKTYTIAEIYAAMTSEDTAFEALLAKEAIRQAAIMLCDITSDDVSQPIPDIVDIRNNAKAYANDMLPGFIKAVQDEISCVFINAKITRKVNITVSF